MVKPQKPQSQAGKQKHIKKNINITPLLKKKKTYCMEFLHVHALNPQIHPPLIPSKSTKNTSKTN